MRRPLIREPGDMHIVFGDVDLAIRTLIQQSLKDPDETEQVKGSRNIHIDLQGAASTRRWGSQFTDCRLVLLE